MKVSAGYTLVELMVVITIVALLLGLGVPSYRYVTNSNRISMEVNSLLGDLQFARSEAIKEGSTVTVCPPNAAGTACDGASTHWEKGWIVISATANPSLLHVQQPFASTKDSFVSTNDETSISFDRNGFGSAQPALNNGGATIQLTTVPSSSQWTMCVEIEFGGMLTTVRPGQDTRCTP
jgi:type IV fimbrial biogenesis protein FimT